MLLQSKNHKWVLVVEDDLDMRESICEILRDHFKKDIKIVEAKDGVDATTKINHQAFHCILTDLNMPKKEGGAFIQSARQNSFNETTPIIIVSGAATHEIEKEYKFVNFLAKPFKAEQLVEMVENQLKLGTTEKMVSANVLNSLVSSTMSFLKGSVASQDVRIGTTSLKQKGTRVDSDFAAVITLKVGKVSNTFSILCDQATLDTIKSNSPGLKDKSGDEICRSMGFVILRHVLSESGMIESNNLSTNDVSGDQNILSDKTGLLIPVIAEGINIHIFATTKQ